jgi:hypothetical protein
MSSELAELLALLVGYLALAAGLAFGMWRMTRNISSQWLRLALRAATVAFLFAPGAVACGGASIVPFSLVVVGDIVGLIAPTDCGPYTLLNFASFLPTLAIVVAALYFLERRRSRVDAL